MKKSQYDNGNIAADYYSTTQEEISRNYIENPNMLRIIGDVAGLDILGVGCGDGYLERMLKLAGANRVVGTDLSLAMLNLGRKAESEHPLGIEYFQYNLQNLPIVGRFDLVTAKYVLNYAQDQKELVLMCQSIYRNLKIGGRLVALVPDYGDADHLISDPKYGFTAEALEQPLSEYGKLKITLFANGVAGVDFVVSFVRLESYIAALKEAGFKKAIWHKPVPSEEGVKQFSPEFWADWMAHPYSAVLEATK